MSAIQFNQSLLNYNTFGVDVIATAFVEVDDVAELQNILKKNTLPIFILGGGSNVLLTKDVDALVIKNNILGKTIVAETDDFVIIEAGAGENWHELVLWTLENDLFGLENLSLIPGLVGAAPIQNIGAYGVELKEVFTKLEAVNLATGEIAVFSKEECEFGYRESIFKKALKGKYCISKVYLKLHKNPAVNISYGAIEDTLQEMEVKKPTPQDVSKAVIKIRSSKLPDPKVLNNSGSFFKNPEIDQATFESLQNQFPNIVFYTLLDNRVKIPAGWLIEQCGWKGKQIGKVGCHAEQALVLINYGGASGQELLDHAKKVADSVKEKFGISLTPEVNVY
jgi:UDP-N-acetylmuramate dehydrogenase